MKSNEYRLGDLITQRREKNPGGDLPIRGVSKKGLIPPKQIDADTSIYNVYYRNDFVYNPARMELGSIAFNDQYDIAICSSLYEVFFVHRTDLVLPEYLALFVGQDEFARYCNFLSSGSAREYCRFANISEIKITLPSIEEQRKIVHDYKVVTDRIELLKKIDEKYIELGQVYYDEIFGDVEQTIKLGDFCTKIGSGATPSGGKESYVDSGISLIRSMNVFDFFFEYDDLAHITDKQAEKLRNVVVEENDVLFNITGVSVTRCSIVARDILPARVNQHVMILRPTGGLDFSVFLLFTLNSSTYKRKLQSIADGGSTRDAITKEDMQNLDIPCPSIDKLSKFSQLILPLYNIVSCNNSEINKLSKFANLLTSRL